MMNNKKTIGLLYGGRSVEHEISLKSAANVAHYLDKSRYNMVLIGIDKTGKWFLNTEVSGLISEGEPLVLSLDANQPGFITSSTGKTIQIDIVFPVLHGTDGEDGSVQGLLKALGLPFVGSGVLGSAVAMNKLTTKKLLVEAGIPTSRYRAYLSRSDAEQASFESLKAEIGAPFIVKPANLGSSVGVSKVSNATALKEAIAEVFAYDQIMICEAFVEGRELECAVMGNEKPVASTPGEVIVSADYDFYTFEAKYVDESAAMIKIPADVSDPLVQKIKAACIAAYQALRCDDFARVDLFLTPDGEVLINEVNTIPGFTDVSMFPKLWENEGIAYPELLSQLIDMAFVRAEMNQQLSTAFNSKLT